MQENSAREMKEFKDEMKEFKDEMKEFKNEMKSAIKSIDFQWGNFMAHDSQHHQER